MTPEVKAGQTIDALLVAAGWYVCNVADAMQVHVAAVRRTREAFTSSERQS